MTEKKRTAEKDLLKLIENPESAAEQQLEPSQKRSAAGGINTIISSVKGLLGSRSSRRSKPFEWKDLLNHETLNKVLAAAAILLVVYLVITVISESSSLRRANQFTQDAVKQIQSVTIEDKGVPAQAPHETQEEGLDPGGRSLFQLKKMEVPQEVQAQTAMENILNDFRLVGIAIEPNPQDSYAMVENATTNVTYFLKKGDQLGEMFVTDIKDERVIFDIGGKIAELR